MEFNAQNTEKYRNFRITNKIFQDEKGNFYKKILWDDYKPSGMVKYLKKSKLCKRVLELMDQDFSYQDALKMVIKELEEELNQYI